MGTRWRGMLAPVNTPTGDGRRIMTGGFTHRPLPLPLKWQRSDSQGHDDSVVIGSLDKIEIGDDAVWGEGELFDDVNPATNPRLAEDVAEAKLLSAKKVIGPSVDPGSAKGMTVLQGQDTPLTDAKFEQTWMLNPGDPPPTEMLFTDYEIAAATLVPIPAFAECRPFELLGAASSALTAAARDALLADRLTMPDLELFEDPKLDRVTPLTRRPLANGWTHVFGHIATHDVCHVGIRDTCTTAPYSELDYREFHRYEATDDGAVEFPLAVGRLTAAYGALSDACRCCRGNDDHACDMLSLGAAIAHHDQMDVLAYGRVGEDDNNNAIWFSGVEAPGIDERGIALLNRQKVSGDWRPFAGGLELAEVLVLSHRNPGFPLPRVAMRGGRQSALVAAGTVRPLADPDRDLEFDPSLDRVSQLFAELGDAIGALAFNEGQKRGPDGRWIKGGGIGGLLGKVVGDGAAPELHAPGRGGRDQHNSAVAEAADQLLKEQGRHDAEIGPDAAGDIPEQFDDELSNLYTELDDALHSGDVQKADAAAAAVADHLATNYGRDDLVSGNARSSAGAGAGAGGGAGMPQTPANRTEPLYVNHADRVADALRASGVPGARSAAALLDRTDSGTLKLSADEQDRLLEQVDDLVASLPPDDPELALGVRQLQTQLGRQQRNRLDIAGGPGRRAANHPQNLYNGHLGQVAADAMVRRPGDSDEIWPHLEKLQQILAQRHPDHAAADRAAAELRKVLVKLKVRNLPKDPGQAITAAARTSGWAAMPLAPDDHHWDKNAAIRRLIDWAGDDISGKYARAFLWRDSDGDPDLQGSYRFPLADVIDGRLEVVPDAVRNALSRLPQADIPAADQDRMRGVLDRLMDRVHEQAGTQPVTAAARTRGWSSLPIASGDPAWDVNAAKRRLDDWAGDDIAGRYARAFLWRDSDSDPGLKGSYKLPIADIIDGRLTIVPAGVRAAASYLPKTDGISADEQAAIRGALDTLMDRIHENSDTVTAAAPEGSHNGAMVALRMTDQDAARLCATGGLPMDELHTTFCYLGESDQITPAMRERILSDMREFAASQPGPIPADGFALNAFNPGTANNRDTAIVLGVGGQELADAHAMASEVWGDWNGDDGTWAMPEQHSPWVPHVTLQYTDDLNAVKKLADRVGPLSFDRVRVAFGGDVVDFPLGAPNTGGEQMPADEAKMSTNPQACADCGKFDACATCTDCGGTPALSSRADQALLSLRLAEADLLFVK